MKKLILISLMMSSFSVMAHGHRGYYRPGWGWVAPTVIGGVIGYGIARTYPPVVTYPYPEVIVQPPVVVQQPVLIQKPTTVGCGPWVEVMGDDGKIYRERTCSH